MNEFNYGRLNINIGKKRSFFQFKGQISAFMNKTLNHMLLLLCFFLNNITKTPLDVLIVYFEIDALIKRN